MNWFLIPHMENQYKYSIELFRLLKTAAAWLRIHIWLSECWRMCELYECECETLQLFLFCPHIRNWNVNNAHTCHGLIHINEVVPNWLFIDASIEFILLFIKTIFRFEQQNEQRDRPTDQHSHRQEQNNTTRLLHLQHQSKLIGFSFETKQNKKY